jgi:cytosine/adenosine deaminase-related metal-dependent hydrolase
MRFLTADYLYPLHTPPLKNGVLQISDKGEVISVIGDRKLVEYDKLEVFKGILCPGFINAHCHLELSHLKGIAKPGKGLLDFISVVQTRHNFDKEEILSAIESAEQQMINNGVVGVGDICNTSDTIFQKKRGNLQYYNFIEVFGVQDIKMNQIMVEAKVLRNKFRHNGLKTTISPHAPYSVPKNLMEEIAKNCDEINEVLTIHIQEANQENNLFEKKKGELFLWLKNIDASSNIWLGRKKSTDIIKELDTKKVLLVHNTFTAREDIGSNYYCTCPKANLFIEKSLPDYSIFDVDRLCVGTDSLASNNSLSILEELQIIKENSNFDLNTLLKIASKNGAEALGFSNLGTFEKGKNPGVNLISAQEKIKIIV